jgi:DNA integrity scanning protein DisA with diadenylate cyclase activity
LLTLGAADRATSPTIFDVLGPFSLSLPPIAVGVAILRYRLYEIDRIISRTISYALVTGLLAATFAILIVGLQAVLTPFTGGQTVAVAASTLAVFALFQPVLRRVRRAVDRRFDRARYDGERTAAAFSERLRDQVDMETVTTDLRATVAGAIAPTDLGVWIRPRGTGR